MWGWDTYSPSLSDKWTKGRELGKAGDHLTKRTNKTKNINKHVLRTSTFISHDIKQMGYERFAY